MDRYSLQKERHYRKEHKRLNSVYCDYSAEMRSNGNERHDNCVLCSPVDAFKKRSMPIYIRAHDNNNIDTLLSQTL